MDIRNVANRGSVERSSDRKAQPEAQRAVIIPSVARDQANISDAGRGAAAAVANLAERARAEDPDRAALVLAARQRLISGELDGAEVLAATAQNLLAAKFLSV